MQKQEHLDYKVSHTLIRAIETELRCMVCLEIPTDPYSTNCGHIFCNECIRSYIKQKGSGKCNCPLCNKPINKRELKEEPKLNNVCNLFRRVLEESSRVKGGNVDDSFAQSETKKRKFEELKKDYKLQIFSSSKENVDVAYEEEFLPQKEESLGNRDEDIASRFTKSASKSANKSAQKSVVSETVKSIPEMISSIENALDIEHEGEQEEDEKLNNDDFSSMKTPDRLAPSSYMTTPNASALKMIKTPENYEFQKPKSQKSNPRKKGKDNISILTTTVPGNFQDEIKKFTEVFKLRQYKEFNDNVTHIIVYPSIEKDSMIQAKRTVKFSLGVIRGVWIVSYRWVVNSILFNEVQDEEEYEVTCDPYGQGAPKYSRQHVSDVGGLTNLFEGYQFFLNSVDKNAERPAIDKGDLVRIIQKSGGSIIKALPKNKSNVVHIMIQGADEINNENNANQVLFGKKNGLVSHKWIMDCISNAQILNYKNYFV